MHRLYTGRSISAHGELALSRYHYYYCHEKFNFQQTIRAVVIYYYFI